MPGVGNLRCAFGCREHHRRQRGNERSRKHYQTSEGKRNKKRLNGQRTQAGEDAENTFLREGEVPPSPVGQPTLGKTCRPTQRPWLEPGIGERARRDGGHSARAVREGDSAENAAFAWEGILSMSRPCGTHASCRMC